MNASATIYAIGRFITAPREQGIPLVVALLPEGAHHRYCYKTGYYFFMKESNHLSYDMVSAGRRIGGYRLLRLLGKGGFGDVYLGEQGLDHSPVAIKILSAWLTSPQRGEGIYQ
jgi:hypothetical protein